MKFTTLPNTEIQALRKFEVRDPCGSLPNAPKDLGRIDAALGP